jgi:hypothetical protein
MRRFKSALVFSVQVLGLANDPREFLDWVDFGQLSGRLDNTRVNP